MTEITRLDLEDFARELDRDDASHLDRLAARNAFIDDGGNPDEVELVERLFDI